MFYEVILLFTGFSLGIWVGLLISVKICATVLEEIKKATPYTPVDKLKNALLSFALMEVKHADVNSGLNMNYADYTGDELPAMSGCSIENACFTYMLNKDSSPFYTKHMEQKTKAIEKYLQHHLNTDEKVLTFFQDFYENLESEKWSLERLERIHL